LGDVGKLILPAVTHWNHPNFHGLFSTSVSAAGIFGELLSAAFDMKAMLWRTSPASTELETVVTDWLRQMMIWTMATRELFMTQLRFHSARAGGGA
jgi:aromatic-L-amino-acid decarboxylase